MLTDADLVLHRLGRFRVIHLAESLRIAVVLLRMSFYRRGLVPPTANDHLNMSRLMCQVIEMIVPLLPLMCPL